MTLFACWRYVTNRGKLFQHTKHQEVSGTSQKGATGFYEAFCLQLPEPNYLVGLLFWLSLWILISSVGKRRVSKKSVIFYSILAVTPSFGNPRPFPYSLHGGKGSNVLAMKNGFSYCCLGANMCFPHTLVLTRWRQCSEIKILEACQFPSGHSHILEDGEVTEKLSYFLKVTQYLVIKREANRSMSCF